LNEGNLKAAVAIVPRRRMLALLAFDENFVFRHALRMLPVEMEGGSGMGSESAVK
jgi:hypothetical protein